MKPLTLFCWLLLALFDIAPATAQVQKPVTSVTPAGYDFLLLTVYEGRKSYLTFAPAFKSQKLVPLSEVYLDNLYSEKSRLRLQTVEEATVNWMQQLSADGWELVQTTPVPINIMPPQDAAILTRYLFRKPRS